MSVRYVATLVTIIAIVLLPNVHSLPFHNLTDVGSPSILEMSLTKVHKARSRWAVCNDGSEYAYYLRKSLTGSKVWVLYLGGGDLCYDDISCALRQKDDIGKMTSKKLRSRKTGVGIMSTDPIQNPGFYGANHVNLPYCTSDLWSGNGFSGVWQFRGAMVLKAVIEDLVADHGIADAGHQILLSGGSAGGIGVLANLDGVASQIANASKMASSDNGLSHTDTEAVTVKGLNDAGWFGNHTAYLPKLPPMMYMAQSGYDFWHAADSGRFPVACASAFPDMPWACYDGEKALPHVSTPMFVQAGIYDRSALKHLGVAWPFTSDEIPYIDSFGSSNVASMSTVHTLFSAACCNHAIIENEAAQAKIRVNGVSLREAYSNWFHNGTVTDTALTSDVDNNADSNADNGDRLQDTCDDWSKGWELCINPTCNLKFCNPN